MICSQRILSVSFLLFCFIFGILRSVMRLFLPFFLSHFLKVFFQLLKNSFSPLFLLPLFVSLLFSWQRCQCHSISFGGHRWPMQHWWKNIFLRQFFRHFSDTLRIDGASIGNECELKGGGSGSAHDQHKTICAERGMNDR